MGKKELEFYLKYIDENQSMLQDEVDETAATEVRDDVSGAMALKIIAEPNMDTVMASLMTCFDVGYACAMANVAIKQ